MLATALINRHVPYIESEMWAPPLGISPHGRYNPVGIPALYLADRQIHAKKRLESKKIRKMKLI